MIDSTIVRAPPAQGWRKRGHREQEAIGRSKGGLTTDQRDNEVRKGAHCAWQIHYHIVFPVKYRKALLDEEVTTIIQETAAEIAERFPSLIALQRRRMALVRHIGFDHVTCLYGIRLSTLVDMDSMYHTIVIFDGHGVLCMAMCGLPLRELRSDQ